MQNEFKTDWEKTKKQLKRFTEEAAKLTKQGEKELIKFSKISKLHFDSTAIALKKEKLYYLIGKEYVSSKAPSKSENLKKLIDEVKAIEKDQKNIKNKIRGKEKPSSTGTAMPPEGEVKKKAASSRKPKAKK